MLKNENVVIRKCDKADLYICAKSLFESDFGKLYYPSLEVIRQILLEATEKDCVLVAQSYDKIIGFVWFSKNTMFDKFPYLNLIFVFESFRNRGIGYMLLKNFEEYCMKETKNPKMKLFLVVKEDNSNAKRFYEENGYYSIGKIEGLFRTSVCEVIMMKKLEYRL